MCKSCWAKFHVCNFFFLNYFKTWSPIHYVVCREYSGGGGGSPRKSYNKIPTYLLNSHRMKLMVMKMMHHYLFTHSTKSLHVLHCTLYLVLFNFMWSDPKAMYVCIFWKAYYKAARELSLEPHNTPERNLTVVIPCNDVWDYKTVRFPASKTPLIHRHSISIIRRIEDT